jgi:adenylate cyclase
MDNEELVRQLNIYFERMVACIQRRKGTFHKFIGDAIMASWSAIEAVSQGKEKDALNAVMACIEMRRELKALNVERTQQRLLPLRIGIGLNHGEVLAGQIGAPVFMEFTLMGDAVNTASRLEGMTKHFTTDIVIGEPVQALIGDAILLRRMGYIVLKGKSKPMMVYEVLTERDNPESSHFPMDCLAVYEASLTAFYERRFEEARNGFFRLAPIFPKDFCIHHYQAEAEKFMQDPPPEKWDGRIVLDSK